MADAELRACMVCAAVRSFDDFCADGCPNCRAGGASGYDLELSGSPDRVAEATTALFSGLVAVADAQGSWVAQHLGLAALAPGMYAMRVSGDLSEDVAETLSSRGIVPAVYK